MWLSIFQLARPFCFYLPRDPVVNAHYAIHLIYFEPIKFIRVLKRKRVSILRGSFTLGQNHLLQLHRQNSIIKSAVSLRDVAKFFFCPGIDRFIQLVILNLLLSRHGPLKILRFVEFHGWQVQRIGFCVKRQQTVTSKRLVLYKSCASKRTNISLYSAKKKLNQFFLLVYPISPLR